MPKRPGAPTRPYHAPKREAAAARTREAIVAAAKREFERRGWSGTTIRSIAARAGVSAKTIEATFGTKAALLGAAVDFSIRGDVRPLPLDRRQAFADIEAAPDASTMLDLHAGLVRRISHRTAHIAWVVEQAAVGDHDVQRLWRRMTKNRRTGVRWATETLLGKHDADRSIAARDVEDTFWIALDWGTYRTLTSDRGMTPEAFQAWLRHYYRRMLLR